MDCVIEPTKSYSDLDTLRQDLALQDVKETPPFRLEQMSLTTQGTLQVSGIGEFPLTEIALGDALRRGGLNVGTGEQFFQEKKDVLDQVIVNAANAYYANSRYATSEVKLITRRGENGDRIILGIPSAKYSLLSHEAAVEKVVPVLNPELKLKRCNLYPEYLEISLTDSLNTTKDAVGEIVEVGAQILNSQGTRTRALIVSSFAIRLVCLNGSTAKDRVFSLRYPHKGNLFNGGDEEFRRKISEMLQKCSVMMRELPRLGSIPLTDQILGKISPNLTEVLGIKETKEFLDGIDYKTETVMHLWNRITSLPHNIQNAESKLKLEQLGFKILTWYLN